MFVSFQKCMTAASLASPLGQELSTALRTHLLPSAAYCAAASSLTFQGVHSISPMLPSLLQRNRSLVHVKPELGIPQHCQTFSA